MIPCFRIDQIEEYANEFTLKMRLLFSPKLKDFVIIEKYSWKLKLLLTITILFNSIIYELALPVTKTNF